MSNQKLFGYCEWLYQRKVLTTSIYNAHKTKSTHLNANKPKLKLFNVNVYNERIKQLIVTRWKLLPKVVNHEELYERKNWKKRVGET